MEEVINSPEIEAEEIIQIDYYNLYCDYSDDAFLSTLMLDEPEKTVLNLLLQSAHPDHRLYIPQLRIESLVDDSNTPYEALRTLYKLREDRIIFYELLEEDISERSAPSETIDLAHDAARKYLGAPEQEAPTSLASKIKRKKKFDRIAVVNVEYSVVYNCLREEYCLTQDMNIAPHEDLKIYYAAIRQNKLATALQQGGQEPILEFLQYIQTIANQPISEIAQEDES